MSIYSSIIGVVLDNPSATYIPIIQEMDRRKMDGNGKCNFLSRFVSIVVNSTAFGILGSVESTQYHNKIGQSVDVVCYASE
jgi:hypothetical protein